MVCKRCIFNALFAYLLDVYFAYCYMRCGLETLCIGNDAAAFRNACVSGIRNLACRFAPTAVGMQVTAFKAAALCHDCLPECGVVPGSLANCTWV